MAQNFENNISEISNSLKISVYSQNDDSKTYENNLKLGPFGGKIKIDMGRLTINQTSQTYLNIQNMQNFQINLNAKMKENDLLRVTIEPMSNTVLKIECNPLRVEKYFYNITFELTNYNIPGVKFFVQLIGEVTEAKKRKTPLLEHNLNPNQQKTSCSFKPVLAKSISSNQDENKTNAMKSKNLLKSNFLEKENIQQIFLLTKTKKSNGNQNAGEVKSSVPIKATEILPKSVTVRSRSTSRGAPTNTAERLRVRMEKNATKVEEIKPVHTNFLKRYSNKTSSNYKSIQSVPPQVQSKSTGSNKTIQPVQLTNKTYVKSKQTDLKKSAVINNATTTIHKEASNSETKSCSHADNVCNCLDFSECDIIDLKNFPTTSTQSRLTVTDRKNSKKLVSFDSTPTTEISKNLLAIKDKSPIDLLSPIKSDDFLNRIEISIDKAGLDQQDHEDNNNEIELNRSNDFLITKPLAFQYMHSTYLK